MTARNAFALVGNQILEFPAGDAHQTSTGGTGVCASSAADLLAKLGALAAGNNLSDLGSIATALGNLGFGNALNGSAWVITIATPGRKWIIQGNNHAISNDTSISFPNAFPNAIMGLVAKSTATSSSNLYTVETDQAGTGGFAARPRVTNSSGVSQFTGGLGFYYIAVGY